MATSAEPARLPHLENERRTAFRKPLPAHSLVELDPGRGGVSRDLSEGGVSFFGSTDLRVGSETRLRLSVPNSEVQIEASGVVAWTDESATGIRFTHIGAESFTTLQDWLERSALPDQDQVATVRTDAVLAAKVACLREIADLQAEISSQELDADPALALIVRRLAELTRATGAAIALRDGEHVICRASYGNAPDVGVQLSSSSLSGECLRSGEVVLLHDSETDPRVDAEICRQLNFRSLLIVPVLSNGAPAGIAEVLSPNPGNFEGGDILVVSFIADLIAGVAVPVGQSEAPATEFRSSFEPLVEPDLPRPAVAFELPIPEPPLAAPISAQRAAEPAKVARPEMIHSPAPLPSAAAAVASTAAAPVSTHAATAAHVPEVYGRTQPLSTEADRQKRTYLAIAIAIVLLIAIAAFAIVRLTRSAPKQQPAAAATNAAAIVSTPSVQPGVAPVSESPKPEPRKPSASSARSAKQPADSHNSPEPVDSHNGPAAQEIVVRESAPAQPVSEAPPDAPSVGQLSTHSSADLAAQIVATNTPAPELSPVQSRGVIEGKLIRKVLPRYPEMARRSGVGGDVVLSATIGTDGKLKNIKVVSGSPLLREEAVSAARQWRYSPYQLGGKPVESDTHITISFKR